MDDTIEATRNRIDAILQRLGRESGINQDALNEAAEEFSTLIEELNTAVEELNANNEILLQTQRDLVKEQQRYQDLFEYAPDAYIQTDINGKIIHANKTAALLFNLSTNYLTKKPLSVFVVHEDQRKYYELLRPPTRRTDVELNMLPRGSPPFTASISLVPVLNDEGQSIGIRWLIRDVTSSKLEHAALVASEERFHTIFTHSHIGMILTDLSGRIVDSNLAFERAIGYIDEELRGAALEGLVHPLDREELDAARSYILDHPGTARTIEARYLSKSEQEVWVRQTLSALPGVEGELSYLIYLIENITQQRLSDEELAEMKRRMIESIETERLHLAQELHDGPIQDLYSAVFKLTGAPSDDGSETDNLKETQDIIKQVAGTLRVICGDLRPPTLSNFGLDRAIQASIEQIQEQNKGLEIRLEADRDDRLLAQDVRLGLFRIYQQCMANVLRHAKANLISIRLEIGGEEVSLSVEDNGVGFEPPTRMVDLLRTGHYGLAGIAERVESLNGSLMIDSSPGNGTRVSVEVPRQGVPSEHR